MKLAGVHRSPGVSGISGTAEQGADSVVLSNGYEDDMDLGDEIVYTGQGGRSNSSGRQVADQRFAARGNAALARSSVLGLPVRVIRGYKLDSPYAPETGYRYDGLYVVEEYWQETGKSGFKVWRYRLTKIGLGHCPPLKRGQESTNPPIRQETTTMRIVRDTGKSRYVKALYDYTCQMCGIQLKTPTGAYAEGAHIKALGIPHNGPDNESNLLCLCPNCHVLFDSGAVAISDDLRVLGILGEPLLYCEPHHEIAIEFIRYHREHVGMLVEKGVTNCGQRNTR